MVKRELDGAAGESSADQEIYRSMENLEACT